MFTFLSPFYFYYLRKIIGKKNIPKKGGFIIALNHSSIFDSIFVACFVSRVCHRKLHFLTNSRLYKNSLMKFILNHYGCIPVDVKKDSSNEKRRREKNKQAISDAVSFLSKGEIVIVFPEGERSMDGNLLQAKTGVAKIALLAKVPILPVGIVGADKILPKGKVIPTLKRVDFVVGKVINISSHYRKEIIYNNLLNITKKVMKDIAKLIKKEYKF